MWTNQFTFLAFANVNTETYLKRKNIYHYFRRIYVAISKTTARIKLQRKMRIINLSALYYEPKTLIAFSAEVCWGLSNGLKKEKCQHIKEVRTLNQRWKTDLYITLNIKRQYLANVSQTSDSTPGEEDDDK